MDMVKLLEFMVQHEASDIYLTEGAPPTYRINGVARPAGKNKLTVEQVKELIYSALTDRFQKEFEANLEVNAALHYKSIGRFRLNAYIQRGQPAAVIRRILTDIKSVSDLGLPPVIEDLAMTKRGLVLVVGATGSGKSTTLAAIIDHRNKNQAGHIITIEDPIEFVYEHKKSLVSQREVGVDTNSFQLALKNALRQAPDVVLLGEIRDADTMEAALTFAETGHLCLATLHANNAYQAIERIMSFFPSEHHRQIYLQLAMNLRSVVSQRLIPTIAGGRIAAVEIMTDSPRIKDLINKSELTELKETIEKSSQFGMQSFDQALYDLYKAGKITLEDALKNADSANNVRLRVKLDDEGNSKSKSENADGKKTESSKPKTSGVGADSRTLELE